MLISIETLTVDERVGEEKALELIKKAGFDAVDFTIFSPRTGDDYLERAHRTKQLLEKMGLLCHQAHAPFGEFEFGEKMDCSCQNYLNIVRGMEYASIIGAKYIVVHGIVVPGGAGTEKSLAYNYEFFASLAPYAKKFGIQIAIENLRSVLPIPFMINELIRRLDDPIFVVCVDVGHAIRCKMSGEDFIAAMDPGLVRCLHIQDNDGEEDAHLLPGLGIVDWDKVLAALAEYGYTGNLNLEIPRFTQMMPVDCTFESLLLSAAVARSMARRLETFRCTPN